MDRWCEEVSRETGQRWYYLKVPQVRKRTAARQLNAVIEWEGTEPGFAI
jgi:hypothetical protein